MRMFVEQQKTMEEIIPQSPIVFAEIVAVDEESRLLKIMIQPWEVETGWCKCLMDTFYPLRRHKTHATHPEHVSPGPSHPHDEHTPHLPQWPYKVGQEVLAAVVRGNHGSEQYVVLGLIDKGPLAIEDESELMEFES